MDACVQEPPYTTQTLDLGKYSVALWWASFFRVLRRLPDNLCKDEESHPSTYCQAKIASFPPRSSPFFVLEEDEIAWREIRSKQTRPITAAGSASLTHLVPFLGRCHRFYGKL